MHYHLRLTICFLTISQLRGAEDDFYGLKINDAPEDKTPSIKHNIKNDSNENMMIFINEFEPDHLLYLTYTTFNHLSAGDTKLYFSKDGGQTVTLFNHSINGTAVVVNDVTPIKEGRTFCVSYVNHLILYLDENFIVYGIQSFESRPSFNVNPHYPELIIRQYPSVLGDSSAMVSIDYGSTFVHNLTAVDDVYWFFDSKRLFYLRNKNEFVVYDLEKGLVELLSVPHTLNYLESEGIVVVEVQDPTLKNVSLTIWDNFENKSFVAIFPPKYVIKRVRQVAHSHNTVYLVVEDMNAILCLFKSFANKNHYIRLLYYLFDETNPKYDQFSPNPYLRSVLYANVIFKSHPRTLVSMNDGKDWTNVTLNAPYLNCTDTCSVLLEFPRNQKHYQKVAISWIWVREGVATTPKGPITAHFMSFEGGTSVKPTPFSLLDTITLNNGGIILSANHQMQKLHYSFDEGESWFASQAFAGKSNIVRALHNKLLMEFISIICYQNNSHNWDFAIVSFGGMLNDPCKESNYVEWKAPRDKNQTCYQGHEMVYTRKIPGVMCLDNRRTIEPSFVPCPCTNGDFVCKFGYISLLGLCYPDPDSDIDKGKITCRVDGVPLESLSGFVRLDEDVCELDEVSLDVNSSVTDFCVSNELTNFILFIGENHVYIELLDDSASPLPWLHIHEMNFGPNFHHSWPTSFDFFYMRIYIAINNTIGFIQLSIVNNTKEYSELFYLHDQVLVMRYDADLNYLFFLLNTTELRFLSLATNYYITMAKNVAHFEFDDSEDMISYVTTDGALCSQKPFAEKPSCITGITNVKTYVLNKAAQCHILHYHDHSLRVFLVNNITPNNLGQEILSVPKATSFGYIDENLFYIVDEKVFRVNISSPLKKDLMSSRNTPRPLRILPHKVHHNIPSNNCSKLRCQYLCQVRPYRDAVCVCPPDSTFMENNTCVCQEKAPNCLSRYCPGFYCDNGRCMLKNVQCNGFDDCGDNSDENNCTIHCPLTHHLCAEKCYPKKIICKDGAFEPEQAFEPITITKPKSKKSAVVAVLFSVFFIVILLSLFYCQRRYFLLSSLYQYIRRRFTASRSHVEFQHLLQEEYEEF